jgi:hypothetical protein
MAVTYQNSNSWGPYAPNCAPSLIAGVPDATAARVEPQSPSGAVITNTGRTQSATQTKLGGMRIER